jgi:hypothetical protein
LLKNLYRRNPLIARFVSNGIRQALGAGLFLATTLVLTKSLGTASYAVYFANWNAANLVAAGVAFGLYNEIIRRLAAGETRPQLLSSLWPLQLCQVAALVVVSWLVAIFLHYQGWLIFLFAASMTLGNLLTAIALGRDRFEVFMSGELAQNASLFAFTAAVQPQSPFAVALLYVASTAVKASIYLFRYKTFRASAVTATTEPFARPTTDYAARAYTHSLLLIATFRGFFMATGAVISPQSLAQIAVPWSFCDRALLVAQGVTQLLYPKILANAVSQRARRVISLGTVGGFSAAVAGMVGIWTVINLHKTPASAASLQFAFLICLAFIPHVVRLLKMNEALAEYRFRSLFTSHLVAGLTFAVVAGAGWALPFDSRWFPVGLVALVSLAGLLPFYLAKPRAAVASAPLGPQAKAASK